MSFSLLVVDDEPYAVEGIAKAIDWSTLGIETIYKAYNIAQAKEIVSRYTIDISLCDIEMPGENGVAFLEWLKGSGHPTKLIFLTGYARFEYAQRSVALGASDFLIKPIDHDILKSKVAAILQVYEDENTLAQRASAYEKYLELWESQKELLIAKFWNDLLAKPVVYTSKEMLMDKLGLYGIDLPNALVTIVLVRSDWNSIRDSKWDSIMMYGLNNIASEMLLANDGSIVSQDETHFVIVFHNSRQFLDENLTQFSDTAMNHLDCTLEFFIAKDVSVYDLYSVFTRLRNLEATKLFSDKPILHLSEHSGSMEAAKIPESEVLCAYIEAGKRDELMALLSSFLESISRSSTQPQEMLRVLYYRVVSVFFSVLQQRGEKTDSIQLDETASHTVRQFESWVKPLVDKLVVNDTGSHIPTMIQQVKAYIQDNLSLDLTRESIANAVFLNPSYLSRLFHKETGQKLSDYILCARIEHTKKMLLVSENKISTVAHSVGYSNDSYFIKVFKAQTGLTPAEYRRSMI